MIPVRQPLQRISFGVKINGKFPTYELVQIVMDEVNVKEVVLNDEDSKRAKLYKTIK